MFRSRHTAQRLGQALIALFSFFSVLYAQLNDLRNPAILIIDGITGNSATNYTDPYILLSPDGRLSGGIYIQDFNYTYTANTHSIGTDNTYFYDKFFEYLFDAPMAMNSRQGRMDGDYVLDGSNPGGLLGQFTGPLGNGLFKMKKRPDNTSALLFEAATTAWQGISSYLKRSVDTLVEFAHTPREERLNATLLQEQLAEIITAFSDCSFTNSIPRHNISLFLSHLDIDSPLSEYLQIDFHNAWLQTFVLNMPDAIFHAPGAQITEELGWRFETMTISYKNAAISTPISTTIADSATEVCAHKKAILERYKDTSPYYNMMNTAEKAERQQAKQKAIEEYKKKLKEEARHKQAQARRLYEEEHDPTKQVATSTKVACAQVKGGENFCTSDAFSTARHVLIKAFGENNIEFILFDSIEKAVAANPRALILGDPDLSGLKDLSEKATKALQTYYNSSGMILMNLHTTVASDLVPTGLLYLFMPDGKLETNVQYDNIREVLDWSNVRLHEITVGKKGKNPVVHFQTKHATALVCKPTESALVRIRPSKGTEKSKKDSNEWRDLFCVVNNENKNGKVVIYSSDYIWREAGLGLADNVKLLVNLFTTAGFEPVIEM